MRARKVPAVTAGLAVLTLTACPPARPETGTSTSAEIILYGARVHSFEGSRLVTNGRAAKLGYQRGGGAFYASEVFLRFPREASHGGGLLGSESAWVELRSPWMTGATGDQTVEANDGVALRTASGISATAQRGTYDGKTNTAQGTGSVQLQGPGYTAHAQAFFVDMGEDTLVLEEQVDTTWGVAP